jgi:uncharacterized protein (TIGR04255 family)
LAKNEETGILDIDHFSARGREYDVDSLIGDMWKLHGEIEVAFRSSVTREALKDWNAAPLGS